MTVQEALNIAKKESEEKNCVECLDFGDFFGFLFGNGKEAPTACYITVNKKDKSVGFFNPIMDMKKFKTAKTIELR